MRKTFSIYSFFYILSLAFIIYPSLSSSQEAIYSTSEKKNFDQPSENPLHNKEEQKRRRECKTLCFLCIKNNLQVCNNLSVDNNAAIRGTLTVGNSSTFKGPVTINFPVRRISGVDAFTVNGNTDLNGNAIMRSDLIVQGDIIGSLENIVIPSGSITTAQLADRSVTETKLADNAVSTRALQDNSISNNKLASASSADVPNTLVLRDGTGSFAAQNIELQSNTNILNVVGAHPEGYKLIGGHVDAGGNIIRGTGDFTVEHTPDSGIYTINFTPALTTQPIVTATAIDPYFSNPTLQDPSFKSIKIHTYKVPIMDRPKIGDGAFSFLIFGIPA